MVFRAQVRPWPQRQLAVTSPVAGFSLRALQIIPYWLRRPTGWEQRSQTLARAAHGISFAAVALGKLEAFLESAGCDELYVFESYPIQSTARVLFQLDAPQVSIRQFWSDLQDRLAVAQPRLIYFQERDPLQSVKDIARKRGPAWEAYLIEALKRSPWMHARALSGIKGVDEMLVEYARLIDRLADLWRFPMLRLPARPELRSTDSCADEVGNGILD
jgi:hypothetical protein